MMRRCIVTGGQSPLGRRVVDALSANPEIEFVRSVETRAHRGATLPEDASVVPLVPDHRPFAEYVEKEQVDTVIQCGVVPDRSGIGSVSREANVIETMCLGAAVGVPNSPIRNWVLASSSAVYPISSHAALMQHERSRLEYEDHSIPASIVDAEDYARDLANRLTHVNVAIMRLQQLVDRKVHGPLASLLGRAGVPVPVGFDPTIQLLHLDDAANALMFATCRELAGVYNVASAGWIHLDDAMRETGHRRIPVLPVGVGGLESLIGRLGIPVVPSELLDLLRFGHVVDTTKIEKAGWRPRYDQKDCLSMLRAIFGRARR